jgi:hypothetical protein
MRLDEIIKKAIDIGREAGFITFDQLNELCEEDPSFGPEEVEALFAALSEERINIMDAGSHAPHLSCSFCGNAQPDVLQLIAGPDAFICDECVRRCVQSISSNHPEWLTELRTLLDDLANKKGSA